MNERIERSCMIAQIAFVTKSQPVIIGRGNGRGYLENCQCNKTRRKMKFSGN